MWGLRRMWEVEEPPGGSSLEAGVRKRLSSASGAVLGPCQSTRWTRGARLQGQFTANPLCVDVCQKQQVLKVKAVKGKLMLSFQEFIGSNPHLQ